MLRIDIGPEVVQMTMESPQTRRLLDGFARPRGAGRGRLRPGVHAGRSRRGAAPNDGSGSTRSRPGGHQIDSSRLSVLARADPGGRP